MPTNVSSAGHDVGEVPQGSGRAVGQLRCGHVNLRMLFLRNVRQRNVRYVRCPARERLDSAR